MVLLLREHLRMPGKDLSQMTLARWEKFCFAMLDLSRRWGWIVHNNEKICPDHAHSQGVKCEKMLPGGQRTIGRHIVISLYAACTGCIVPLAWSSPKSCSLPRRCLHGVHRQKPTNCGTPFCSIRRESVDSFSEINNKDSCADYFPILFCCQGDLYRHYRQPRTGNRPVLRCEQHRLFLFILSSHYRRLL